MTLATYFISTKFEGCYHAGFLPVVLSTVSAGLALKGGIDQAKALKQQGRFAFESAQFNRRVAINNAVQAKFDSDFNRSSLQSNKRELLQNAASRARLIQRKGKYDRAALAARLMRRGASGSSLDDVLGAAALEEELEVQFGLHDAFQKARGIETQKSLEFRKGKRILGAGFAQGAGILAEGRNALLAGRAASRSAIFSGIGNTIYSGINVYGAIGAIK